MDALVHRGRQQCLLGQPGGKRVQDPSVYRQGGGDGRDWFLLRAEDLAQDLNSGGPETRTVI
jgi:hypothetical protein